MPNIDFSQARILIWGRQQLPQQLLAGQLQHLLHLQLRNNGVAELPANIWQLSVLQELCISGCHWLQTLPESLHQLKALQRLTCSDCQALVTLPESVENMTALQQLDLTCCAQLTQLPLSVGELTQLRVLDLSNCCSLAALPESVGQLLHLEQLRLDSCVSLTELPESIGKLAALNELNLSGCCMLKALPEPSQQLQALRTLHVDGCTSLVQPLPDRTWSPQRQIKHVLRLQRSQPAVIKLATQQETMLTTLERMSWLAVLLATATFIAFMQPPGGLENEQVLVSDSSACSWHAVHAADGTSDDAADRQCAMLVFFIMDGLSFGFSMGCVMLIIVLSMPRLQYEDQNIEARSLLAAAACNVGAAVPGCADWFCCIHCIRLSCHEHMACGGRASYPRYGIAGGWCACHCDALPQPAPRRSCCKVCAVDIAVTVEQQSACKG
jgi:hypothetical protein